MEAKEAISCVWKSRCSTLLEWTSWSKTWLWLGVVVPRRRVLILGYAERISRVIMNYDMLFVEEGLIASHSLSSVCKLHAGQVKHSNTLWYNYWRRTTWTPFVFHRRASLLAELGHAVLGHYSSLARPFTCWHLNLFLVQLTNNPC
jgi:hypothetical protein